MAEDTTMETETDDGSGAQDQIARLEGALKKERKAARDAQRSLKQWDGLDADDVRDAIKVRGQAEEDSAKARGAWEELKLKLESRHTKQRDADQTRISALEGQLQRHLVSDQLTRAISEAGFHDDYRQAARLELLQLKPKMVEGDDGSFRAVFVDDLEGEVDIKQFVKQWSKSAEAQKYMPGSGVSGGDSQGGVRRGNGPAPTIIENDAVSIGRNLEAIASGAATVERQ